MKPDELDALDLRLRLEAEQLLEQGKLRATLATFGKVAPVGGFLLRCMADRHLEVYLEVAHLLERDFFALGGELAALLAPGTMAYQNRRIQRGRRHQAPRALEWKAGLGEPGGTGGWQLTLWALEAHDYRDCMGYFVQVEEAMTPAHRLHCLSVLTQMQREGEYVWSALEVAQAVVYDSVTDYEAMVGLKSS